MLLHPRLLWDLASPDVWMNCSGLEAVPTKLLCINGPLGGLASGLCSLEHGAEGHK